MKELTKILYSPEAGFTYMKDYYRRYPHANKQIKFVEYYSFSSYGLTDCNPIAHPDPGSLANVRTLGAKEVFGGVF